MAREAGGFVSDLDGSDAILTKHQIVAGNEFMHKALLALIGEAARA
jgi:myo-inositol-1(or 4)-monophosphatase